MNYLQILLLAVVQGLAELLPVSSSAHVILAERLMVRLMGMKELTPGERTYLLVMLHTGTMFAVIVYFWRRWTALLWPDPRRESPLPSRFHFVKMVLLASVVTGVVGYGLLVLMEKVILARTMGPGTRIETLFHNLYLIGASLFVVALVILFASWFEESARSPHVSWRAALVIGLVQALCLPFRGLSRSGATISTGFFCGVSRRMSEDFSFALAVVLTPAIIVRSLLTLNEEIKEGKLSAEQMHELLPPGLVGMACSFLAGLAALWFLSAVLERGGWKYFGLYCVAASAAAFAAALAGF
jgi:undecaprenyl-diphosphatase